MTSSTGGVLNFYDYDPFGVSLNKTEAIPNLFQYGGMAGLPTDSTGVLLMHARTYLAGLGRFAEDDPTGIQGGTNLLAYVVNNPVSNIDPAGTEGEEAVGGAVEIGLIGWHLL